MPTRDGDRDTTGRGGSTGSVGNNAGSSAPEGQDTGQGSGVSDADDNTRAGGGPGGGVSHAVDAAAAGTATNAEGRGGDGGEGDAPGEDDEKPEDDKPSGETAPPPVEPRNIPFFQFPGSDYPGFEGFPSSEQLYQQWLGQQLGAFQQIGGDPELLQIHATNVAGNLRAMNEGAWQQILNATPDQMRSAALSDARAAAPQLQQAFLSQFTGQTPFSQALGGLQPQQQGLGSAPQYDQALAMGMNQVQNPIQMPQPSVPAGNAFFTQPYGPTPSPSSFGQLLAGGEPPQNVGEFGQPQQQQRV